MQRKNAKETAVLMNEFFEINESESGTLDMNYLSAAIPTPAQEKTLKMSEIFNEIKKRIGGKVEVSPRRNQEHARIVLKFPREVKPDDFSDAQMQSMVINILKDLGEPVEGPRRDSKYSGTYYFYKIPVKSDEHPNGFDAPGKIEGDNLIIVDRTKTSKRLQSGDAGQQGALNALKNILINNGAEIVDPEEGGGTGSNQPGQRTTDVIVNYKIGGREESIRAEVKSSSSSEGKDIAFFDKTFVSPEVMTSLKAGLNGKNAARTKRLLDKYGEANRLLYSVLTLPDNIKSNVKRLGMAAPSLGAQFSSKEKSAGRVSSEINKYIDEEKFLNVLRGHWSSSGDNIFAVDLMGDIVFFSTTDQEYTLPGTKEKLPPFTKECIKRVKLTSYGGTSSEGRIRVAFRASIDPGKGRRMSTILKEWAMKKMTSDLLKEFIEK